LKQTRGMHPKDEVPSGQGSLGWLWQFLHMLPRKYRKQCRHVYLVHASADTKLAMGFLKPLISPKFAHKVSWVETLDALMQMQDYTVVPLPPAVLDRNAAQNAQTGGDTTEDRDEADGGDDASVAMITAMGNAKDVHGPLSQGRPRKGIESMQLTASERRLLVGSTLGDCNLVKEQLGSGISVEVPDGAGLTPLMLACRAGQFQVVQMLVAHKADLMAQGPGNVAPLSLAIKYGHTAVAEFLGEQGAVDPQAGGNALASAASLGHRQVVEALLSSGAGSGVKERGEAMVKAAEYGDKEVVARLLATRTTGGHRARALIRASEFGHYDVVRLMLEAGVGCNQVNGEGSTALMKACVLGHEGVVRLLLANKALPHLADSREATALHLAVGFGLGPVVTRLIAAKAPLESADAMRLTPLAIACDNGYADIAELLIEVGHGMVRHARMYFHP